MLEKFLGTRGGEEKTLEMEDEDRGEASQGQTLIGINLSRGGKGGQGKGIRVRERG